MKNKGFYKWTAVWVAAILLMAVARIYQNNNGPTKPVKAELWINDDEIFHFKLPRSHGGNSNCMLELNIPDQKITGEVFYRRYPTQDEWSQTGMVRVGKNLAAFLPHQPPAGKLEYYLAFHKDGNLIRVPAAEHVIIRFRGDVPAGIIIPHASLMFIAMLLSNVTLFLAIFGFKKYRLFGILTLSALFLGGIILGPLVQKYAFGQYWTGFPVGFDLTDNKTLIAFVFWVIAVAGNFKKERKYLTILAALVMITIFTIPHSARGSELDPKTGKIKTGMIISVPGID